MNIFYVHTDPVVAAQSLVDKHVVRMILESCQMLSTAHRVLDGREHTGVSKNGRKIKRYVLDDERDRLVYQATHHNHPSTKWARDAVENYLWLVEHTFGLLDEYTFRYGKIHNSSNLMYCLQSPPQNLRNYELTPVAIAMDPSYIVGSDPVTNYRNYYRIGKKHIHKWTKRTPPVWIEE